MSQPSKTVYGKSWAIPNKYYKKFETRDRTTSKFIEKQNKVYGHYREMAWLPFQKEYGCMKCMENKRHIQGVGEGEGEGEVEREG